MSARLTGLQAAHGGIVAQLRQFHSQASPPEWAALLRLVYSFVATELEWAEGREGAEVVKSPLLGNDR